MLARICSMTASTLLVTGLFNAPGLSTPIPEQHRVELNNPVEISIKELDIDGCTILDDNTFVVVGGKQMDPNDETIGYVNSPAAGKILNLDTKAMQSFTGGHKKRLCSVAGAADGALIVTSSLADSFINVWDVRAKKSLKSISFSTKENLCYLACLAKTGNIAVTRHRSITLVDLAKPENRVELAMESRAIGLAWSPDGIHLACLTDDANDVVIWDVAKARMIARCKQSIVPDKEPDSRFVGPRSERESGLIFLNLDSDFTVT